VTQDVVIVGAGLAGLSCAVELRRRGISARILESSDGVGGKVRTDVVDGFLLDRGFQVLLTAYPDTSRFLDYEALGLREFVAGAQIWSEGRFAKVADPTRHPTLAAQTVVSQVATVKDKLRLVAFRQSISSPTLTQVLDHPEVETHARLRELEFSPGIIRQFFKPFLGGIFLEQDLTTSSRKFEFVFRMFSLGAAALPQLGMGQISQQLAAHLDPDQITFGTTVTQVRDNKIELQDGTTLTPDVAVIATDARSAKNLLGQGSEYTASTEVVCLYYGAESSPVDGPWLVLNGSGYGPVNNLCVPNTVQPGYAPAGKSLVSVTVLRREYQNRPNLENLVRAQLSEWFGPMVQSWRHLATYRISNAVPLQAPPALSPPERSICLSDNLYCCGDHTGIASIEGAIRSGIRTAACICP
jgi:phytoene dehydrogenase-like protein